MKKIKVDYSVSQFGGPWCKKTEPTKKVLCDACKDNVASWMHPADPKLPKRPVFLCFGCHEEGNVKTVDVET